MNRHGVFSVPLMQLGLFKGLKWNRSVYSSDKRWDFQVLFIYLFRAKRVAKRFAMTDYNHVAREARTQCVDRSWIIVSCKLAAPIHCLLSYRTGVRHYLILPDFFINSNFMMAANGTKVALRTWSLHDVGTGLVLVPSAKTRGKLKMSSTIH